MYIIALHVELISRHLVYEKYDRSLIIANSIVRTIIVYLDIYTSYLTLMWKNKYCLICFLYLFRIEKIVVQ
jgi:hypothetical protein